MKAGYGKAGKQKTLSNFPTATTTTNYNYLWDTHSEGKVTGRCGREAKIAAADNTIWLQGKDCLIQSTISRRSNYAPVSFMADFRY
jgi:hypothetical protein